MTAFLMPLVFGPMEYEYERNQLGDIKTEILCIPLSNVKITFMNAAGETLPGHAQNVEGPDITESDTYIRSNGFIIEHPSIDRDLVKSFEIKMDYSDEDPAMVRIEMYVGKKKIEKPLQMDGDRILDL